VWGSWACVCNFVGVWDWWWCYFGWGFFGYGAGCVGVGWHLWVLLAWVWLRVENCWFGLFGGVGGLIVGMLLVADVGYGVGRGVGCRVVRIGVFCFG